jgi:hypothetical protein
MSQRNAETAGGLTEQLVHPLPCERSLDIGTYLRVVWFLVKKVNNHNDYGNSAGITT